MLLDWIIKLRKLRLFISSFLNLIQDTAVRYSDMNDIAFFLLLTDHPGPAVQTVLPSSLTLLFCTVFVTSLFHVK